MQEREQETLMEQVRPEDLPTAEEKQREEFIPSPKWKRVLAWVLFGIVTLGVITWLLNIAMPDWTERVLEYFRN